MKKILALSLLVSLIAPSFVKPMEGDSTQQTETDQTNTTQKEATTQEEGQAEEGQAEKEGQAEEGQAEKGLNTSKSAPRSFLCRFADTITPSPLKRAKFFVDAKVAKTVGLSLLNGTILIIDAAALALAGYEAICGITSLAKKFGWTTKELNYALPLNLIPNKAKEVVQEFILKLATKLDKGKFIKFAKFVGTKLNWSKKHIINAAKTVLNKTEILKLATSIGVRLNMLQKLACKFGDCLPEDLLDKLH